MQFPFFPNTGQYRPDEDEQQHQRRSSDSSLIKDFLTKPIPLPIWLWNLIVIAIYLTLLYFVVHLGLGIIAGIIVVVADLWNNFF